MNYSLHFAAKASSAIDEAQGIIYGCSVITGGVEAQGHGLWTDSKTLSTVKDAADKFPSGVKVKLDHGSGFTGIVGFLKAFRIDGNQLKADLHLLKSHPNYTSTVQVIRAMADTIGLSIAFSGERETLGDKTFIRVTELYSIDIVEAPAANPGGLFQTGDILAALTSIKDPHRRTEFFQTNKKAVLSAWRSMRNQGPQHQEPPLDPIADKFLSLPPEKRFEFFKQNKTEILAAQNHGAYLTEMQKIN
ncbi:MAG: hypothetical protein JWM16_6448 [Verrucomicrobiales bacterium]|nr:hypothetical protein [Verrucomicrobiales bacterium]